MDWNNLVTQIKDTGMTQAQIAKEVGVSEGTLSELCSGKVSEPKWSRGAALIALHADRCGSMKAA